MTMFPNLMSLLALPTLIAALASLGLQAGVGSSRQKFKCWSFLNIYLCKLYRTKNIMKPLNKIRDFIVIKGHNNKFKNTRPNQADNIPLSLSRYSGFRMRKKKEKKEKNPKSQKC